MERLQRWVKDNRLSRGHPGPKETVDLVLRLVAGMQGRIDSQRDRIADLSGRLQRMIEDGCST
jgi:hypothetical protein